MESINPTKSICLMKSGNNKTIDNQRKSDTLLVRVVKGDWKSKKTIFLSEPMTIKQAMNLIKELVKGLPLRGDGTELVKFVEDKGDSFDYMSCGGWLFLLVVNTFLGSD